MKTQDAIPVSDHPVTYKKNKTHNSVNSQTISKRSLSMNTKGFLNRALASLLLILVACGMSLGQGKLKNGGTYTNTGTTTFKEIQNYNGSTGGTINNSATLNASIIAGSSGDLLNTDGTHNGTVNNFIAAAGGTINVDHDYTNNGGTTSNTLASSIIKIANVLNNSTPANFDTQVGTVEYTGTVVQTINANVASNKYGNLAARNGGATAKTLGNSITVDGTVTLQNSTLAVSTYTLTVKGAGGITDAGSGALTAASGTVDYAGNVGQTIFPTASYGTLTLSSSAGGPWTKTSSGSLTVGTALNVGANNVLDVTGAANTLTIAALATVTNNDKIKVQGTASFLAASNITIANTFEYYGGNQTIAPANYANLTLSGSETKTFTNAKTYAVSGTYDVSGHTGGTPARTYGSSIFQYRGAGAQTVVSGATAPTAEAYGTLEFYDAGTKSILATRFVTATAVTIDGVVSVSNTLSVAGTLTVIGGDLTNNAVLTNSGTITVQ